MVVREQYHDTPRSLALACGTFRTALLAGAMCLAPWGVVPHAAPIAEQAASAESERFFETEIRPVLSERCYACHGPAQALGGIRLDESPGPSAESMRAMLQPGANAAHPPTSLPTAELELLLEWTSRGAPRPAPAKRSYQRLSMDELVAVTRENHWAFRPVQNAAPPAVGNGAWVQSPVDTFILASLEKVGLAPSAEASRAALIRRAYHDLLGLPPTQAEIVAFESDPSPTAYADLIDRLLASPRFGERWGRHWLDVARYSDTKGSAFAEERLFPFAHTYRDYVIRAFNEDLPYDRFIVEQLAADKLPLGDDKRALAALGFLTLGRTFGGQIHDRMDDRIDVVTRGLLALTVSCARCHDHKFDPIPTADYYSLYGIFRSSREPAELPLIGEPDMESPSYKEYLQGLAELETALARDEAAAVNNPALQGKLGQRRAAVEKFKNTHPGRPDRAMALEDAPALFDPAIFLRGDPNRPGDAVPRRFPAVLERGERSAYTADSGRLDLARAIASRENPLTARVFANRVWMHLFDKPLAGTPSDFGLQGEAPTHPELLDHLAWSFMEHGWSVKHLIRSIMLSSTYRQSSDVNKGGLALDPENKLLWRQNRRRLGFEAMRDHLLAASGNLDLRMGGIATNITLPPYSNRRTIYAEVDREALPAMFRIFDFATPTTHTPARFETTVPQQALYLMNNPFVAEQARHAAARPEVLKETSPPERVRALYRALLNREALAREVELGVQFVAGQDVAETHVPEREAPRWLYGYGRLDETRSRVAAFTELPHWTGEAFQGDAKLPGATLGWAMLNRLGGRPGDPQHAVIRRWISPVVSKVAVVGELYHYSSAGDGVKGYIVSSRSGVLWQGEVQDGMLPTVADESEIRAGDTIDLVVECKKNEQEDLFRWHPRIYLTGDNASQFARQDWISRFDFEGPPPAPPIPLQPWEQYAQVLLMSNEFIFVD
ncbi:MAG: DUF1553 domain-containing protein [Candidatus Hydrogenedentes bacterium]|nr:DUF1553 domain-containing protein [Candidatus Hydrogenedentota bacterium]